jgi:hypothetical protein
MMATRAIDEGIDARRVANSLRQLIGRIVPPRPGS